MSQQQQPVTNANDFNTMQNMFSTINLTNQPVTQPKQEVSGLDLLNSLPSSNVGVPNTGDYSTMQMLFATGLQGTGLPTQSISTPPNVGLANPIQPGVGLSTDFNTMQNLFATNNLGGFPSPVQPIQPIQPAANAMNTNFYSVGNLYATGNLNQPIGQSNNSLNFGTGSMQGIQNITLAQPQVAGSGI